MGETNEPFDAEEYMIDKLKPEHQRPSVGLSVPEPEITPDDLDLDWGGGVSREELLAAIEEELEKRRERRVQQWEPLGVQAA